MGFHYVGQPGFELNASNLPTSGSQSAGITGVSHHTWPGVNLVFTSLSFITAYSYTPSDASFQLTFLCFPSVAAHPLLGYVKTLFIILTYTLDYTFLP